VTLDRRWLRPEDYNIIEFLFDTFFVLRSNQQRSCAATVGKSINQEEVTKGTELQSTIQMKTHTI